MPKSMLLILIFICSSSLAAPESAPDRDEGEGPFGRLILRGVTLIAGDGAPARGPVDIIIEENRIAEISSVGNPGVPIIEADRPAAGDGDHVMDLEGHYVLPGFVDLHGHLPGDAQGVPAEYTTKLWLAHGVTTVRDPGGANPLEWALSHAERSEQNEIAAPRIFPYVSFGDGRDDPIATAAQAREWVQDIARDGANGIKLFGAEPHVMQAVLEEAPKNGLRTAMHHQQLDVVRWNVLDSARAGLTTMEHWYGLPEAMFDDERIQNYPAGYNYYNEQDRFGQAGRLWRQAAKPDSEKWQAVRDELIELDFTIDPTLNIYEASRDLMRDMNADWHQDYTHPNLWAFFQPSRRAHGSYWFDWTTADEVAWKENYRIWMEFLNDYKNHGGRVTLGTDSGYIWKVYGFAYVREMELLQEAGFHPLEVIKSATINGAEALGMDREIGSVHVGKLADLVITEYNPLQNFKLLYGTGHFRLNDDDEPVRVGGVRYTIKDGIVYDARELLSDVRAMVHEARVEAGQNPDGPLRLPFPGTE